MAFHAMMFSFTAAAIQCAFVDIAADLDVSVHETTYLVALFIAVTGSSPLFWGPMSNTFGRRPIFLISLACTLAGNVACALSPSYLAMAGCRAITAFFVSPAASLGSAVVSEIFFKKNRGRYMGVYRHDHAGHPDGASGLWLCGVPGRIPLDLLDSCHCECPVGASLSSVLPPLQTNSVQFLLHFFLGSEARYDPTTAPTSPPNLVQRYFGFRRINPKPIRPFDFVRPLTFVTRKCVIIAASSHAMVFLWCTVMTTLEIPQIFPKKFGLNAQEVGLQNIGNIVGTLVGEQVGGFCSDKWMLLPQGRGKAAKPEFRLWLSYMGYILAIVGVVIFLLQIDNATNQWNVTPLVGAGIAAAGNQIVTTVMVTYAVDCYPKDAAAIGGLVNFVRQTWGFIGPFWYVAK